DRGVGRAHDLQSLESAKTHPRECSARTASIRTAAPNAQCGIGLQQPIQPLRHRRNPTYDLDALMYRRGNYTSGEDFVLEYGELRFTFNERDFRERCEQAARKLGFLGGRVEEDEAEDLINLVVNGEGTDPASA